MPGITPALLAGMVSDGASAQLRNYVIANPDLIGETVEFEFLTNGRIDQYVKGNITRESSAGDASLDAAQLDAADRLLEARRDGAAASTGPSSPAPTPRRTAPRPPASAWR